MKALQNSFSNQLSKSPDQAEPNSPLKISQTDHLNSKNDSVSPSLPFRCGSIRRAPEFVYQQMDDLQRSDSKMSRGSSMKRLTSKKFSNDHPYQKKEVVSRLMDKFSPHIQRSRRNLSQSKIETLEDVPPLLAQNEDI
mmetsp:Transcript_33736/g.52091  ORF Transcript_33736/g.52091 Transcript_33736/m.52091 type:complete len:138 (+) Transcript_33736:117-530(+)